MDKMSGIELFAQVARQGSLVAAGRQLGLSASAVGKGLARLEQRLGARLVHRSTRRLALTTEGSQYLARCLRILDEAEAAERELQQGLAAPSGRLKVGLPHESGLLTPPLADFMRRYPQVALDLDYSDRLVDVIGEGFDVVVRGGEPADSRLAARRLGGYRMRLLASPGYLAEHGEPATARDLLRHRCLHYRLPHSGKLLPWPLLPDGDGEVSPPISASCNTGEALIALAARGMGIACLPDFTVRRELAAGTLVQLARPQVERSGNLYLLWPAAPAMPPRLRAFIDHMAAHAFAE
ncbi:LysR family transcriptional regulator [Chromobacterium sp. ATCC 53434]|uniref:LysR family transcriptional regulator n=1 Tax=Chromobacterium sp. (strain ATCC 53434 / SC 14030) TaxID=2059672 RepID=UPI000C7614B2|nr:LysR family transcriptional regulator [Chromobacterium sp. ATCC 53434]AUH53054.1 LysR family transcriptional regulator [Chromobacterium sp. ATCC 53434]